MATITVYDARGYGINNTRSGSFDNPASSNVEFLYASDYGNGYGSVYFQVYGDPSVDQFSVYAREVDSVLYMKKISYFNQGQIVLKIDGIYLTVNELQAGNTALLAGNDAVYGNSFADSIAGYAGNDKLYGRGGNDYLRGDAGNDILYGGNGNDRLAGGSGADRFVFNSALGIDNRDVVTDFTKQTDLIVLDDDIFTQLFGTSGGAGLNSFNYRVGQAADGNDFLLYNTFTDTLSYDDDGVGPHAAIPFATITLPGTRAPAYTDFLIIA